MAALLCLQFATFSIAEDSVFPVFYICTPLKSPNQSHLHQGLFVLHQSLLFAQGAVRVYSGLDTNVLKPADLYFFQIVLV